MSERYLSFTEVADRLGIKTGALATYKAPRAGRPHRTHARLAPRDHRPMERPTSRQGRRWRQAT